MQRVYEEAEGILLCIEDQPRMDPNSNKSGILRPIKSLSLPVTRQKSSFYYTREEASYVYRRKKNKRQDSRPQYTMRETIEVEYDDTVDNTPFEILANSSGNHR